MRASWLTDLGEPPSLEVLVRPELVPGPGQVVVGVRAAAVNFPDTLLAAGRYQLVQQPPFSPGSEFAGVAIAVGEGVTTVRLGDRVAGAVLTGAFAEQVGARAADLHPVPAVLTWPEAAAYRVTGLTAVHALTTVGEARAGETVVVLGAAGGVGSACVAIAAMLGARVVAVVSSAAKAAAATALGAAVVVNHRVGQLRDELRAAAPRGTDLVVDPVGGSLSEPALRSLRPGGRFVVVGFASGQIPRIPLNLVLLKSAVVRGFELRTMAELAPAAVGPAEATLERAVAAGWRPLVDSRHPLEAVGEAMARVSSGAAVGKVVIEMEGGT